MYLSVFLSVLSDKQQIMKLVGGLDEHFPNSDIDQIEVIITQIKNINQFDFWLVIITYKIKLQHKIYLKCFNKIINQCTVI